MRDIIVGRLKPDVEKFGLRGTILLGKQYIRMGRTQTLSNNIYMDVTSSHVMFIAGKRGGGKSYTMGVIAEGVADLEPEIKQNLAFIFLDTMGVYWTMKYPNKQEEELLEPWGMKAKPCDVTIFTPIDYYHQYKEEGIPTDKPFSIKPSLLDGRDWCHVFDLHVNSPHGIAITRVSAELKKVNPDFSISDLITAVQSDDRTEQIVKDALENMLLSTQNWGVFDVNGTPLEEIAKGGQITILDVSAYATLPGGWRIKQMIVGLISQKLFIERMKARKKEEYEQVKATMSYFSTGEVTTQEFPLVWLVIDEAHEFLPHNKEDWNIATEPLVTIMREGRQPGISLILATQQPGKIHTDVMTQSDIVLSTRLTARMDVEALGLLTQSYMKEGLVHELDLLPRVKGAAVIFDDSNEKLYPMRVRPRFTWHGGKAPSAIKPKKEKI
ncbi:ATP-binding protein [Candidatus Woesearchaeota archaeon]|nr:MAG: ATP-binding protein [Candidatus Woesearchaeota archaeon]